MATSDGRFRRWLRSGQGAVVALAVGAIGVASCSLDPDYYGEATATYDQLVIERPHTLEPRDDIGDGTGRTRGFHQGWCSPTVA